MTQEHGTSQGQQEAFTSHDRTIYLPRISWPPARRNPAAGGRDGRQGVGGGEIRRRAARARARGAGAPAGAPPLLLEERQVGASVAFHGTRRGRILGVVRLPQLWRPVA